MSGVSPVPAPELSPAPDLQGDLIPLTSAEAVAAWEQMTRQAALLLRQSAPDASWLQQLMAFARDWRALAQRDLDAALYLLLQSGTASKSRYSACHAVLCALICERCAEGLAWPAAEIDSLVHAALTMNLSMTELQDTLAAQREALTAWQREQVDSHAQRSAVLLEGAGIDDRLWLEVVRLHHDVAGAPADASPSDGARLAQLLHRVDIYTAKLSSRAGRESKSPAIAARDTCLGADGVPDKIGAVLLRTLGLYPPGCFVQLANGDYGVVVQRGLKAHTPMVAALRRDDGWMYQRPKRRHSGEREHAVVCGVTHSVVKVRCDHQRNLDSN